MQGISNTLIKSVSQYVCACVCAHSGQYTVCDLRCENLQIAYLQLWINCSTWLLPMVDVLHINTAGYLSVSIYSFSHKLNHWIAHVHINMH